jgi:hypothetical protein
VHAGGAASQRHVQAIVDDDAGAAAAGGIGALTNQLGKRGAGQVRFPDLYDIDPCRDRVADLLDQTPAGRRVVSGGGQALAIGDEMKNQERAWSCVGSPWSPTRKTGSSSKTPAIRLTRPRPLTAPRTKLLAITVCSDGHSWTK